MEKLRVHFRLYIVLPLYTVLISEFLLNIQQQLVLGLCNHLIFVNTVYIIRS
jgi:hypothetical protein